MRSAQRADGQLNHSVLIAERPLCSVHIEHCHLCSETFCPSCLTFHQSKHTKSAKSHQATESPKKKTA
jgi:hypothetical protein